MNDSKQYEEGDIMFSERLSLLRTSKKLTHQDMADRLGITRQAYGLYESGKREPDFETLQKLADFFDVDTDYLLGRTNKPKIDENGGRAYYGGSKNLSEEEIIVAEAAIEAYRAAQKRKLDKQE